MINHTTRSTEAARGAVTFGRRTERFIGARAGTSRGQKIYANEGVAQVLFIEGDEVCETSYKDRGGKYQGQQGVTLPKI